MINKTLTPAELRPMVFLLLAAIVILGPTHEANAQRRNVYFPYFEFINVEPDAGLQYSTSRLLKAYIEDHHDYHIILPSNNYQYYEKEEFAESTAFARERNADLVLTGAIVELGDKYVISMGLHSTRTGEQIWHDMVKGNVREDLDPLLSRLGRNFNTTTKAMDDAQFGEVTNYESQIAVSTQNESSHYIGGLLGGTYILHEQTVSGFGIAYTFDAANVFITANMEYYPSSANLVTDGGTARYRHGTFNVGAAFPLSHKHMTFFAQGGMDYGFHTLDRAAPEVNTTNGGVGFFVGGGYLINRHAAVNLRVNAALTLPLYLVDGEQLVGVKFGLTTSFAAGRKR